MMLRNEKSLTGEAEVTVTLPKGLGQETFPIKLPQIFTKKQYKALRKAISTHKRSLDHNPDNDNFLFRGRLFCGICGSTFHARRSGPNSKYRYYACPNAVKSKKTLAPGEEKCKAPWVPMKEFDDFFWKGLTDELFKNPNDQLKAWQKDAKQQTEDVVIIRRKLNKIYKALEKNKHKSEKLVELFVDPKSNIPKNVLYKMESDIKIEKEALDDERIDLETELDKIEGPKLGDKTRKEAARDIKQLAKVCEKKAILAPMRERQKLLDYILGKGPALSIYPMLEEEKDDIADEVQWETGKRPDLNKIKYYVGDAVSINMDVTGFINALKVLLKTGEVPPFIDYIEDNDD
jgi:hypothetical protein